MGSIFKYSTVPVLTVSQPKTVSEKNCQLKRFSRENIDLFSQSFSYSFSIAYNTKIHHTFNHTKPNYMAFTLQSFTLRKVNLPVQKLSSKSMSIVNKLNFSQHYKLHGETYNRMIYLSNSGLLFKRFKRLMTGPPVFSSF